MANVPDVRRPFLVLALVAALLGACTDDDRPEEGVLTRSGTIGSEAPTSYDVRVVFHPETTREQISEYATEISDIGNRPMRARRSMFADYDHGALLVTYEEGATAEEVEAMRAAFTASPLVARLEPGP